MGWLDRISVRTKLWVLGGSLVGIAVALWAAGFAFTARAGAQAAEVRRTLQDVARASDLARQTSLVFKTQVQEWKDMLLRGHDPAVMAAHRKAFEAREAEVDQILGQLRQSLATLGATETGAVDAALARHRELGGRYREALALWNDADPLAYRKMDARVKGIDRPMADALDALAAATLRETGRVELRERAETAALLRWSTLVSGVLLAAGVLLAVLVSGLVSRRILAALAGVRAGLGRLAEGDFTGPVEVRSRDELGAMAEDFNRLQATLNGLFGRLRGNGDQVASGSAQLSATAVEVAQTAREIASFTDGERATAEQVAAAVTQFSASVQQVASHVRATNGRLETILAAAEDGARQGAATLAAMRRVHQDSQAVAGILSVIAEIANQTNLLSLNAAIEAAKAGEQGRGFAVVAGQVGELAVRSSGAAEEIGKLMGQSAKAVGEGLATVQGTEAALRSLRGEIQEVARLSREIGAASEEQARTSSDLAQRSEASSAATARSAAASQELTATVDEVNRTAEHLARIAEDLAGALARFKTA